jgi:predicted permease
VNAEIHGRLAVILLVVALGVWLQRSRLLGSDAAGPADDPSHALAQLATYVLVPALLFRTMARLDFAQMPWAVAQAYFAPVMVCCLLVFASFKWVQRRDPTRAGPAAAATRAMSALYGNAVQLGVPLAAAMFGEPGLAIHIALVSLHGLILLTSLTLLAEYDLAQSRSQARLLGTLGTMARQAILHPVVLPVLLGLAYQRLGLPIPGVVDQALATLGQAVVPICLLLIGMNLARFGLRGTWRAVIPQVSFKLLFLPAAVLASAYGIFGLTGTSLQVAVMMAALPVGTNALIFAQRYRMLQGEAASAMALSTVAFALTAPLWLWLTTHLSNR